jgi:phage baseplate assembly protein W
VPAAPADSAAGACIDHILFESKSFENSRSLQAMNIDFPFHFDARGRTAATDDSDHIRDMIEEFLFTNPGERVNRPDFGSGLLQLVFAPNSPELAATVQFTIQAGLQLWLSDLIAVQQVDVTAQDSTLSVLVQYVIRSSGQQQAQTFVSGAPS